LDFEGDTGPYLQYTHARAGSILRKATKEKLKPGAAKVDFSALTDPTEEKLVVLFSNFHSKILESLENYKPHLLAQHLLLIGRAFNEFYHKCPVIQEKDNAKQKARLLLVDCARQVIKSGLALLGITAPEEM
jgi:arginyl-tRNA synthetase